MECNECVKKLTEKLRGLQRDLKPSKVKCKCFCPIHREKCPLTPVYYGQRRWPGCDGNISEADRDFLNALNPQPAWWRKAWGRGSS